MTKSILIVTGDAGESYEALYASHRFLEAGDRPVVAAPSRRRLHLVMHVTGQTWQSHPEFYREVFRRLGE
jgi:protease I